MMRIMRRVKKIGECVHLIDERNTDLGITKLVGLTIEKRYIPSVANIIGTDLSKYKIIRKGRFACSLMQVSRDEKMPVAMFADDEPAIISPAYPMFEVNNSEELLPEYLNMYLMRKEFDREAVFLAVGGVRGSLEWDDFMNIEMLLPDIDEQRRIVNEFQSIEKRIEYNNRLIQKLEDTSLAIYFHYFEENIDIENLPEGWKTSLFYDAFEAKYGKGLATEFIEDTGEYPVYGANGVIGYYDKKTVDDYKVLITSRGSGSGEIMRTFYKEAFVTNNAFVVSAKKGYKYCELPYIYCLLRKSNVLQFVSGSAQPQLTNSDLNNFEIILPSKESITNYCNQTRFLFDLTVILFNEISEMDKIKNLLLEKI